MSPGLEHAPLSAERGSRVDLALHHPIDTEVIHLVRTYIVYRVIIVGISTSIVATSWLLGMGRVGERILKLNRFPCR